MAHRGRLNVLVNLLGKSPKDLFSEFEGQYDLQKLRGSGDVKYHKGFSADLKTPAGNVHVALAFNPSHLEVVNPVVEGSVRARQERRGDAKGDKVLPVLIHGDAAFAGQGVIMETLQLSQARGFYTGGSVHVIINNQVGFTTCDPRDARSTLYCSDVAKMVEAPIFHVNADDPEAVCFVTRFALEYRHEVPQGRGDRSGLLSPARPQRGRRAGGDAAADVPGHPQEADRAAAVRGQARGRGRADGRRGGRDDRINTAQVSTRASRRRGPRSA